MLDKGTAREWATALTLGSFAITALTGILIFFHVNIGLVKSVHTWLSWLFVLSSAGHVFFNRRACVRCVSRPVGGIIAAVCVLLLLGSLLPLGSPRAKNPAFLAADALLQAPLAIVAQVAKSSPEQLVGKLKARGIEVGSPDQTLVTVARKNNTQPVEILNLALEGTRSR